MNVWHEGAHLVGRPAGRRFLGEWDAPSAYSVYGALPVLLSVLLPGVFLLGLSTGATLRISRYLGANDGERPRRATHNAVLFALAY